MLNKINKDRLDNEIMLYMLNVFNGQINFQICVTFQLWSLCIVLHYIGRPVSHNNKLSDTKIIVETNFNSNSWNSTTQITSKMAANRERRGNAGNKMARLMNEEEEEDDFYKTSYGGFTEDKVDADYLWVRWFCL